MQNALKIYGIPQSRAARCLWMARELKVPHENVPVHFKETRSSPELLEVNPNARIPALDDNGLHLWESLAINLYLAKKYGAETGLAPKTLEEDALATQWSFWAITELERSLLALLLHAAGRALLDEAEETKHRRTLAQPLDVLNRHLAGQDWLLGDRFMVADLNVASVLSWTRGAKLDLSPWPGVAAWLGRCLSRPAAKG